MSTIIYNIIYDIIFNTFASATRESYISLVAQMMLNGV